MPSCLHCGVPVSRAVGARGPLHKYCSESCRNSAKWLRQKAANPCPVCGGPMSRSSSSAAEVQRCRKCQVGERKHGTTAMYDKGKCRCGRCKAAVAARQRRYAAKRKAEGRPIDYSTARTLIAAKCCQCDVSFMSRTDGGVRQFCSLDCANDFQGRAPVARFRIARSKRIAIYEACGWVCQLCMSPVRDDVSQHHPRYPTLDHIVPRAHGGADDPENLRLACFQCNTRRGTNVDWVPEVVEVRDESSQEVA